MSEMKTEKRNPKIRKLSLHRETLRTLQTESLERVAGGLTLGCSGICSARCVGWCSTCGPDSNPPDGIPDGSVGPYRCIV